MKLSAALSLALSGLTAGLVSSECLPEMEIDVDEALTSKLSFAGFKPVVNRITNTGVGNKVVLKGFAVEPIVEIVDGVVTVTAGEPCDEAVEVEKSGATAEENNKSPVLDGETAFEEAPFVSGAVSQFVGLSVPFLFGRSVGVGSALLTTLALTSSAPMAFAQEACDLEPIEVDIFVDTGDDPSDIVAMELQVAQYNTCPPESTYWEHSPEVFGGYKGCVGERALYPCPNDASSLGDIYEQTPIIWDGEQCVETGYTMENRTFVIAGGNPYDTYEINKRTGMNPVIHIPYNKGPYPSYDQGSDPRDSYDETNDARIKAFKLMEYIGAWDYEYSIENWDITITEGAEQGMVYLWAAKAIEIAQTTCNRDIKVICEAPCYGYSTGDAAEIANRYASTFYNSTECTCFEDDSCLEPKITVEHIGWLPLTDFPTAVGGDGNIYPADSLDPNSPWFENIVFPENPSGVIKSDPILAGNPNRIICDGVYLWPMYMGARDFQIPMDEVPDCAGWAFSISKIWSAAARAGWIIYKKEPEVWNDAISSAIGQSQSFTNGILSDWTWNGQAQVMDILMSKPLNDTTSWIGAYSSIIKDKWDYILDAFTDCPIVQPTNPYSGAYVWFAYQPPYLGLSGTGVPSFFRDVIGVESTSRSWQFRGAEPSDYYGPGYSIYDFIRLNLYRDIRVYEEVGRRGAIVCNDFDAAIGNNTLSVNEWVALWNNTETRRHLSEGSLDREERKNHILRAVPHLSESQLEYLVEGQVESERQEKAVKDCAPSYHTQCIFDNVEHPHKQDYFLS